MITKNIKFFLVACLVGFAGFWGANLFQENLEDFFYWHELGQDPELFLARVDIKPRVKKLPVQQEIEQKINLEIKAESAISVLITPEGNEEVLFEKNISSERPIASLTKLMTALVAQKTYNPDQILDISKEAVNQEEETGQLSPGEELSLNELMHIMLIESSNDAAWAISEGMITDREIFMDRERFVESMNWEVRNLGLKNTHFINSTGLDGLDNYSTGKDLIKIAHYIIENYPQIFEITQKQSYKALNPDGTLHHFIPENTNKLLGKIPGIVGGKTGYTEEAGGCILLVLENENGGYFINIVLGTESLETRFQEMEKLVDFCRETI